MTTWVLHKRHNRRDNRSRAGARALTRVVLLAVFAMPVAAWAADSGAQGNAPNASTTPSAAATDQSKEQLIRTLVNLTDTPEVQALFSQELINRVSSAISMFGPTLNPQTMNVISQQTRAVVSEHINDGDALYSVLAPVYEKHFNLIELAQLVQFYKSPLGQKLVNTSPELMSETMDLGSQWGLSLVPEIVQRVRAQLNAQNADNSDTTAR
ncbi:DUF2059 domain-containing protein [Salinisphaera hydrothermalis]|uniref:DUF2059 domain-containing protein n=1 Tax=Salinisphaera hydrothermalis TaxID=563188 RepID=UPI00333E1948